MRNEINLKAKDKKDSAAGHLERGRERDSTTTRSSYTQKLLYKRFGLALRSLPAAKYATQDEQNLKLFCSIWWALKIPIGKEACSRGAIRRGSFTLF